MTEFPHFRFSNNKILDNDNDKERLVPIPIFAGSAGAETSFTITFYRIRLISTDAG